MWSVRSSALTLSIVASLAACATTPRGAGGAPSAPTHGVQRGKASQPTAPLTFVPCTTAPCMVHPRTGGYHQCLHAAGGTCFTYGASCTPVDSCIFDPVARAYRTCVRPLAGTCAELGAACTPKGRCLLDPTSGKHRACEEPAAGGCARYGATCEPT